jgi:hypothetical protein
MIRAAPDCDGSDIIYGGGSGNPKRARMISQPLMNE